MIRESKVALLYTIAVFTVIGLVISNQIIAFYLLKSTETDANIINIAGKQRMLSQKIALEAHKSIDDFKKYEYVKCQTRRWVSIHYALKYGDENMSIPQNNSEEIKTMFEDIEQHVEVMQHLVSVAESEQELGVFVSMISNEAEQYLPKIDRIVQQYQVEAEERLARLKFFEILMTVLSVIILGVEFIFIFRPVIDELRQQNKRLQRLNLSKDRLISTIAHDLRNPLNGIKGMIHVVRDDIEEHINKDHKIMFDLVVNACDKSNDLIQELLEISILESDELEIRKEKTFIKEFLIQTLSQFQDRANQKGVNLKIAVENNLTAVNLDQKRFRRVIDNLITNALKFTSSPGQVSVESYEKSKSVIVKIKDNGIGIPKHMQQFIFDKFSKARRKGLEGEQTTGLGMSIVKQIVELHKGNIWVESAENIGTEFYIELPKIN